MPAVLLGMALEHRSGAVETPCPVGAPAEIHYAPNEDLERIDVALLGGAEKQIDMAAYVLTDRSVIEALREAAGRGVSVRIWRDANMAEGSATSTSTRSSAAAFMASRSAQTRPVESSCA
jgi:phosphatidylserine/phosphatidylglycerophosphate/cardiolipin synthase-like enzyme